MEDRNPDLTPEELAEHEAADLPDREAMSLLDPSSALGAFTAQPLPPQPTDGAQPITLPKIPLPQDNPGGIYSPDTSASSET